MYENPPYNGAPPPNLPPPPGHSTQRFIQSPASPDFQQPMIQVSNNLPNKQGYTLEEAIAKITKLKSKLTEKDNRIRELTERLAILETPIHTVSAPPTPKPTQRELTMAIPPATPSYIQPDVSISPITPQIQMAAPSPPPPTEPSRAEFSPSLKIDHRRLVCPECGSTQLKEVIDRRRVLTYIGAQPIYQKNKACKSCRHEWMP